MSACCSPAAGFSLSAVEELLADNLRLAAAAEPPPPPPQQQQQVGEPSSAPSPQQLRKLQQENEALRQQLMLSESLRRKGQKVLRELKQVRRPGQNRQQAAKLHCVAWRGWFYACQQD